MNSNLKRAAQAAATVALAYAVTTDGNAQTLEALPQITVEGDQITDSVKAAFTDRSESPNAKVVIEGEQLNQFNDMSVGDAIRRLPGVTFSAVNRSREIKLRGIPREYTQVLLDGRPLLDGDSTRSVEVDRIPAVLIDRIEIIRSPLASMNSAGAAGTVNIITKRQSGKPGGGISVGGGYLGHNGPTGDVSGWSGGQYGNFNYFIGGGQQRRLLEESNTTLNNIGAATLGDGGTIQRQQRRFDETTFTSRFEYKTDENNTFTFSPSYFKTHELRDQTDRRLNNTQTAINRITNETRNRDRENIGTYFEWLHTFDKATTLKTFVDYQKAREDTTRDSTRYSGAGVLEQIERRLSPIALERVAPGTVFTRSFDSHVLEAGVGAILLSRTEDESRMRTVGSGTATADPTRKYKVGEDIIYGYLSDRTSVFGPDQLTLGLRVEASQTRTTDNLGLERSNDAVVANPSLQYRYSVVPDLDLRLGVARTVRRPDLRDLTPTVSEDNGTPIRPDIRGNPDARPEHIWGVDIGFDKFLDGKSGILSANLFGRQFDDKLERTLSFNTANNRWVSTLNNAGEGRMMGAEVEARVPLTFVNMPHLTLWGNAVAVHTELTDKITGQQRRFAEQPDLVTNLGLDYFVESWKTTFGINYNRTYAYSQDILQPTTTSTTVFQNQRTDFNALNRFDVSVRVMLRKDFTISFGALNLLRPTDRRVITTTNMAGNVLTQVVTTEPSNSLYYARAAFTW